MAQISAQSPARMPVFEAISTWLGYCRRYTERTQSHYSFVIHNFAKTLPEITLIGDLNACYINAYISKILSYATNATANRHLIPIKSFFRWLSENYGLPNRAEPVRFLREDPPQQRFLSLEEITLALAVCSIEERDCLNFLLNTGLRASECCALTWPDITDDWIIVRKAKGRKRRKIPLNSTLRKILARYPRNTHIRFLKSDRKRLYHLCCKASRKAGISRFGPHALRRAFATNLAEANVPLAHISILLGHSSLRTTELYLGVTYASVLGDTECLCK